MPQFAFALPASNNADPAVLRRYVARLAEELRYTLNHLDDANVSEGGISSSKIAGLSGKISALAKAEIGQARIGAAQIQDLEAQVARVVTAVLGSAVIDWAQITRLAAVIASIAGAQIATARIGWAQIDGLTADTALFTETEAGKLYAADLEVTNANIVDLNAGKINAGTLSVERLVIVGSEESIVYEINRQNGTTQLSQTTIDGGSLTEKTITADKLIANGITAECLNVEEIFSNEALVGAITAKNINVADLFASEATAGIVTSNHLSADVGGTLDISANGAITLLTGQLSDVESAQAQFTAYFRFDDDGLHIGRQGEAIELLLQNDRISFMDEKGAEVAYVSSGKLYITEAEVTASMKMGNFAWNVMEGGSLGLMFSGS